MAVESLEHYGEAVENSELGLRRLKEDKFDLVILDLMLGDQDGLEVLTAIKTGEKSRAFGQFILPSP